MTQSKHTPTPWRYKHSTRPDNTGGYDTAIIDIKNKIIAETFQNVDEGDSRDSKANAELIVKAVNCHDELIEAITLAIGLLQDNQPSKVDHHALEVLKQALSKTRG